MGFATVGEPGLDAPENGGFFVSARLYAKDIGEQMALCNSDGEDTD